MKSESSDGECQVRQTWQQVLWGCANPS